MKDEIKRIISYIINFVLLRPLSFGNPTNDGISDGSTSSTVSFACGFAVLLITIVYFTVQFTMENFTNNSLWGLLVFILVSGTVATGLLLTLIVFCQSYDVIRRQQLKDRCVELEIKFLWFSGLGVLFRAVITLAIQCECVVVSVGFREISDITLSCMKIIFMLIQMFFITYLRNSRLLGGLFINYLIGGLFLANTSTWANYVTFRISDIYIHTNGTSLLPLSNQSIYNECFNNSKMHKVSRILSSFFLNVSMLFLLLSSMFLIRLWPLVRNWQHMRNSCIVNAGINSVSGQPDTSGRIIQNRRTVRIISFFVGFLINSPFFTMAILMKTVYSNDIKSIKVHWDLFVILVLAVMIVIVLVGIQNLNLNCLEKTSFSTWDLILMMCMTGNVIMNTLGITSIFLCNVDRSVTIFTKNLLNLFTTYYHTVYIIVAKRTPHSEFCKSISNLSIHVILFCSCLGRWFLDMFVLNSHGKYILKEGEGCLFPDHRCWLTAQYFLIPLNAFYDFQSFVFYYGKIW